MFLSGMFCSNNEMISEKSLIKGKLMRIAFREPSKGSENREISRYNHLKIHLN